MTPDDQAELKLLYGLDGFYLNSERTGKPLWRGGGFAEVYFPDGHTQIQRAALIDIWERYYNLFPTEISHYLPNNQNRLRRITDGFPSHFREVMPGIDSDLYFDGELVGDAEAAQKGWPTPYAISGAGKWERDARRPSSCSAYFPAIWMMDSLDAFVSEMLAWCDIIKPRHGLAGVSVVRDTSSPPYSMHDTRAFPFLRRYPGLDYSDTAQFSLVTRRAEQVRIRGTNWLTVIDDALIEELGGRNSLDEALSADPAVLVHEWTGGVLIQAGPRPQVGDVNAGRRPEHYGTAARALAPIRFEDYTRQGYFRVPSPLDEISETLAWIRRFD